MDILQIKNLEAGYTDFKLADINIKVEENDIMGIIGPNGSGKTTLLKVITKILKIKSGEIFLENKNLSQFSFADLAQRVAVVSQNPEIPPLTIEEFVLMGRIPFYKRFQFFETKQDQEILERCLTMTDIQGYRKKFLWQLSGGERQMAFIARALCQQPDLILLDEPTAFLDITHQVKVMDLIKKLNRTIGLTVVMVLHDLNLASEYCKHLVLINNGKVHKAGTPDEVLTYKIIEEVYQTVVIVKKNPLSNRPHIFLVSEENQQ